MPDEIIEDGKCFSTTEYLPYKLDRNIAIAGVIGLGAWALQLGTPESIQIAMVAIGGLVGYIGGRTSK